MQSNQQQNFAAVKRHRSADLPAHTAHQHAAANRHHAISHNLPATVVQLLSDYERAHVQAHRKHQKLRAACEKLQKKWDAGEIPSSLRIDKQLAIQEEDSAVSSNQEGDAATQFAAICRKTEKDLFDVLLQHKQQQLEVAAAQLKQPYDQTLSALTQLANMDPSTKLLLEGWKQDLTDVKTSVTLQCSHEAMKATQLQEHKEAKQLAAAAEANRMKTEPTVAELVKAQVEKELKALNLEKRGKVAPSTTKKSNATTQSGNTQPKGRGRGKGDGHKEGQSKHHGKGGGGRGKGGNNTKKK
jgi:hypothetical protein